MGRSFLAAGMREEECGGIESRYNGDKSIYRIVMEDIYFRGG